MRRVRNNIADIQTDAAVVSSEVASSNLRALAGSLVAALDGAVDDALLLSDCAWVSADVDAALDSLESLAATLYVAGGFGFLLCAALLFLYMPSAIAVQIVHGGVGKQPGCPTFCRSVACCGAGHGRGASVQDVDMGGTMVVMARRKSRACARAVSGCDEPALHGGGDSTHAPGELARPLSC